MEPEQIHSGTRVIFGPGVVTVLHVGEADKTWDHTGNNGLRFSPTAIPGGDVELPASAWVALETEHPIVRRRGRGRKEE